MTKKNDYFRSICEVSRAFGSTRSKEELLGLIVQSAVDTMKEKASCLWLLDKEGDEFIPAAYKGLSRKYFQEPISAEKISSYLEKDGYMYSKDVTGDDRLEYHDTKKSEGIVSGIAVPVSVQGKMIGALSLFSSRPKKFSKEEIEFLSALAEQGGMALEQARLIDRIKGNTKIFYDLAANINSSLDVKYIFQALTSDIAKALNVKAASVRLLDENKQTLELVASYGLSDEYLNKGSISAEKSISEALKGRPVVIKNASTDEWVQYRKEKEKEGIKSILCVPIKAREKVIGVLRLYSRIERDFTDDEVMLVSALAYQGGLAIQNASLYLKVQSDMQDLKDDLWSHRSWF